MNIEMNDVLEGHPYFIDVFNRLGDAVYFCNIKGELVYINKVAENLDDYSLDDVYGRTVQDAYGLDKETSPLLRALTSKMPVIDSVFRYYINGKEIIQVCNAGPLLLHGEVVGAYTIQRDVTKIKEIIERNISLQQQLFDNHDTSTVKTPNPDETFAMLLGEDPRFIECKKMAVQSGKNDSSVMITANTGCGKELFAKCIHNCGTRKDGPFLALNCAAIPESLLEGLLFGTAKGVYTGAVEREGLFEQASGGTLFLDEINSMPLSSQAKILRVLEDRSVQHLGGKESIPVDVRIISSSNTMPQEAIERGEIRADLFYRLSVVNIMVPPLAERQGDVFLLTNHFIAMYNERFKKHIMGLDDEVLAFFLEFDWPGNVRQLKHCIEAAMNFVGDDDYTIKKHHLPPYLLKEKEKGQKGSLHKQQRDTMASKERSLRHIEKMPETSETVSVDTETEVFSKIRATEKQKIIDTLIACDGNVSKSARILGMGRQSLLHRIKKYNIK